MLGSIGFPELVLVFVVVLLVFGPKKLPEFARTLGRIVREFRSTVDQAKTAIQDEVYKEGLAEPIQDLRRGIQHARSLGDEIGRELKQALDVTGQAPPAATPRIRDARESDGAGTGPAEEKDGQAED